MTLVVIDAVGLTPRALTHMPRLRRLAAAGFQARVDPVLPAVTCSVQSTFLTGLEPTGHGIVGNGWYFRDLGEVFLWRQHNRLVAGDKVWETARARHPGYTAANVCWWYAMGASTDITVTPRPIYHADGRKSPDAYVRPPSLHDELTGALGEFPLFQYWGPTASLRSSEWIVGASRKVFTEHHPDLLLVYVPHLDYDLQRFGPDSPAAVRAAREVDDALAPLLATALDAGATVVALSEYGIPPVRRPTCRGSATCWPLCPVWTRCSTGTRRRGTASTTRGRASSSSWPSRTPGSPTTTGSTTPARRTSRAASRSTASPATTRPSCSSTLRTGWRRPRPG